MKLNSKHDIKIKKYLNSIAEDKRPSKLYNSIHYLVIINNCIKDIRFSDHVSNRGDTFISIVKISDTSYQIEFVSDNIIISCIPELVVDYIKGYILMANYFLVKFDDFREALRIAEKELIKVSKSEMFKEIKFLKDKIKDKDKELSNNQTIIVNLQRKVNKYQTKIETLKSTVGYLSKVRNILNNDLKEL